MVLPDFHTPFRDDLTPAELPPVSSLRKIVSVIVMISMMIPPSVAYSAPPQQKPLEHFAPQPKRSANPFAWPPVTRWIPTPMLLPATGKSTSFNEKFASSWRLPRTRSRLNTTPRTPGPATPWAPSDAPLYGEITPPDGMPTQAPFPTTATPQAQPGMPLEVGICVIVGEVSDASSLNPIAGAIIDAVGTGRSVESEANGKFRIEGLPPGSYTLEAGKLGYFSETAVITAIEAQPAEARFGLRSKPTDDSVADETMLDEETIVGEYQEESQGNFNLDLAAARAFQSYRKSGGQRIAPLPDFFIGAHAEAEGLVLLTRDSTRDTTYFPRVRLICP